MHTINIDCWCHVCAQAKAEYRLRADRAEERQAELEREVALMTHSRDSFREAVIAGEGTRARAAGGMTYDHCGSDMCPASSRVSCACSCARCMQSPIDDDRVCGLPDSSCKAEVASLRAALAAREAEVAYLRAHRTWLATMHAHDERGGLGAWLAANPEPQPPRGVKP